MDMTADTVLDIFKDITRIPRESGHEGPMTAFLQEFAAKRNLECRTDKTFRQYVTDIENMVSVPVER